MTLAFPPQPQPVGTVYQRWTWSGLAWMPTATAAQPMLPIAGGNITGNLGVAGTTSLTGSLTAAGHSALNTLNVNGQANFADGVEIDGVDAADFATQQYVDEAVTAGGLWRGTWAADTNTPDLTDPDLHMNGWSWTIMVPDPTAPFDVPATPAIPGVSGQTVYNGDRLEWSTVQSAFVYIQGSSLSLQEAQGMFPAKADAITRGTPGTYTQGTDFTDFQTFLDEEVNNRFFDGAVTIELNVDNTGPIKLGNVFSRSDFFIVSTAQIAGTFNAVSWYAERNLVRVNAPLAWASADIRSVGAAIRLCGTTNFGDTSIRKSYAVLGETAADNVVFNNLVVDLDAVVYPTGANSTVTITAMTVQGRFVFSAANTGTTIGAVSGSGDIVDNRPGGQLDTFLRRAGGTMQGAITMPGDPSGSFDVATKNYVDNKAITPSAATNFPFVTSLPNSVYAGGLWQYQLTIPGWTFASNDLIIIRNASIQVWAARLNVNGLGPRPIILTNYFQGGGGFNSRWHNQNLGQAGNSGQGTYGLASQLAGIGGWDFPAYIHANYIILQYTGGAGGSWIQRADYLLQQALTRASGGTLVSGLGHQFYGASRLLSSPTAQEIIIWQHQPYTILNLSGTAGQREIYFRTRDISTFSIHNRNIRGQTRRLQGMNQSASAMTLRISPRSDSWSGMLEAGCGPYNFTSSYRLQAPMRLYNSGVIASAPGAGYIDAPIPAGAQIEIKFRTWEESGLGSTRTNISTFSVSSFPNARTVVFIEDINVYVAA